MERVHGSQNSEMYLLCDQTNVMGFIKALIIRLNWSFVPYFAQSALEVFRNRGSTKEKLIKRSQIEMKVWYGGESIWDA